jgi:hypothetical protein
MGALKSTKAALPRKKGSGKVKYKNTTKEARVNTTEAVKMFPQLKGENLPKQLDREEKVRKGVRTESPSTPKVQVKSKIK